MPNISKNRFTECWGNCNSRQLEQSLKGIGLSTLADIKKKVDSDTPKIQEKERHIIRLVHEIYNLSPIASLTQSTLGFSRKDSLSKQVYGPTSIPPETFSESIISIFANKFSWDFNNLTLDTIKTSINTNGVSTGKEKLPDKTQEILKGVILNAQLSKGRNQSNVSDLEHFRIALENWFSRSQNQTIGIYKRNSKFVLFWIGFIAAVFVNANTFHIIQTLYVQNDVREALTSAAVETAKDCKGDDNTCAKRVQETIDNIKAEQLPIGWKNSSQFLEIINPSKNPIGFAYNLLGWIISGFAIMMGAPFWFDILKHFVNVRNAAPQSDNKEAKDGQ